MKRACATVGLIGVLVGVPIVLLMLGGSPTVPSFDGVSLTDTYMPLDPVLELVGLLAWILWAYVAGVAVLRAIAVAFGHGSGHLMSASSKLTPRPLRLWVDLAMGGALLASTINLRAGADLDSVARAQTVAAVPELPRPHDAHTVGDGKPANFAYRVRAGDSLWRIAERKLGSGFRWREIFELNRGTSFNHDERLTDPRLIRPGWVLELPKRASRQPPIAASPRQRDGRQQVESPKLFKSPPADTTVDPSHGSPAPVHPVTRLPSGLVVATSFASGLLTAELLAIIKRRRRFRPLVDSVEQPADPDLVRELRGSSATQMPFLDAAVEALTAMWIERFNESPPLIGALETGRRVVAFLADVGAQLPSEVGGRLSPRIAFRARQGTVEAEITGPFSPHLDDADERLESHGLVPACHGSDAVLHLEPFGLGLVSFGGPRANGMALHMLIASATRSSPDDLNVILLGASEELRAAEALPHLARSVSWEEADDALRDIQAELLRRARMFLREGVENARAYMTRRPAEQLLRLVVVAGTPPNALRGVVEAAAVEASRLGAAFVALGWRPQETQMHALVADRVEFDPALFPQAKGFAPFVLDGAAAQDAVGVLRSAFIEESAATDDEVTVETESAGELPQLVPIHEPQTQPTRDAETTHEAVRPARPELLPPASVSVPPAPEKNGNPCAEIRCLGPIVVARSDGTIPGKGWRAPAKEMLAYLVLHPDGVHKERLAELFLPGMPTKKALDLVARAASVVRTRVRTSGDDRKYIELEGETWRLERGAWRVDAWDMERLIDEERHAEPDEAIGKLRAAVALYRGEFSDDAYFGWAQSARERYRALFLRSSARLAERLNDTDDRDDALATLDRAIEIEPLCEDLYRQAMLIEASLGRRKEALQRFDRLKQLLAAELNCSPDPETERLARHIERDQTREHVTSASRN